MDAKQLVGTVIETVLKVVVIVAVVMFTYKYATNAYSFGYRVFAEQPVSGEETAKVISIAITEEATPMDIGKVLEEKSLISDAKLFYIQELLSGYHNKLKPGVYELSSDMTADEMMAVMASETEPAEDAENADDGEAPAGTEATADAESAEDAENTDSTENAEGIGAEQGN